MNKTLTKRHGDSRKKGTSRVINKDNNGNIINKDGTIRKKRKVKTKDVINQVKAVDITSENNVNSRKELEENISMLTEINGANNLTESSDVIQNKSILEEENRILKEKLYVIDRERQDLRLILESRESQ